MDGSAFAALVGSGNLTGQGLGRNTEAATAIQATGADATALVNTWGIGGRRCGYASRSLSDELEEHEEIDMCPTDSHSW